jgi:hypothetical protein
MTYNFLLLNLKLPLRSKIKRFVIANPQAGLRGGMKPARRQAGNLALVRSFDLHFTQKIVRLLRRSCSISIGKTFAMTYKLFVVWPGIQSPANK